MRLVVLLLSCVLWGVANSEAAVIKVTRCAKCCENATVVEYEYEMPVTSIPTIAPTTPTSSPTTPHFSPTKAPITLPPVDRMGCRNECFKRHEFLPASVRRKPLKVCGGATIYWNCSCSASTRRGKNGFYFCVPTWVDPATGRRRALSSFANVVKRKMGRPKIVSKGGHGHGHDSG